MIVCRPRALSIHHLLPISHRVSSAQVSHFLRAPMQQHLIEMLDRDMEFNRGDASGEAPAWSALDELSRDAAEDAVRHVSSLSPVELWTRVGSAPARWRGAVLEGGISCGGLVADVHKAALVADALEAESYAALLAPPRVINRLTLDLQRASTRDLSPFADVLHKMPSLHTLALHGPLPTTTCTGTRDAFASIEMWREFLEEFTACVAQAPKLAHLEWRGEGRVESPFVRCLLNGLANLRSLSVFDANWLISREVSTSVTNITRMSFSPGDQLLRYLCEPNWRLGDPISPKRAALMPSVRCLELWGCDMSPASLDYWLCHCIGAFPAVTTLKFPDTRWIACDGEWRHEGVPDYCNGERVRQACERYGISGSWKLEELVVNGQELAANEQ